jgi:chlorobactene glucosyltransferase
MLFQFIIAIGLVGFLLNLILNLKSLKKPSRDNSLLETAPMVSILVPARDEEDNIGDCLESLRKQDYPSFEILVLDDNSTDRTGEIVSRIAAIDNRVKLIQGAPLPEGWSGKPFACHQMAKRAKGDWLLFVDADTTHAPNMLKSVLPLAAASKVSMLSGFPRQIADSLPQKVAIPVIYFIIMSWLPLWWLQRSGKVRPSLAIGQFLLFRTDEYWRIGGHESVKSRILEDVWLGVQVHKHKGRHILVDLSSVVSCNMYRDFPVMWRGFIRWIYSIAAMSPLALVALLAAAYFFYFAPFYWLVNSFVFSRSSLIWWEVIIFQVAVIFFMRWLVDNRFKEPAVSTWLHPVGFSFLLISAFYAGWRKIWGAGISWKTRLYKGKSAAG